MVDLLGLGVRALRLQHLRERRQDELQLPCWHASGTRSDPVTSNWRRPAFVDSSFVFMLDLLPRLMVDEWSVASPSATSIWCAT